MADLNETEFQFKNRNSKLYKHLQGLLELDGRHLDSESARRFYSDLQATKAAIKSRGVNLLSLKSFEAVEDVLSETQRFARIQRYARRFLHSKIQWLKTNDRLARLFEQIQQLGWKDDKTNKVFFRRLAAIHLPDELCDQLQRKLDQFAPSTPLIEKIQATRGRIVMQKGPLLVVSIPDYPTSQALGSSQWCVSTDEYYWEDYSKEFARFFIVYDQSKPTSDELWQTGFHTDPNGRIKFWEDQYGKEIIGTERECVLKKQIADCPALAPLSFSDAKKEISLTQRDEVKFLINYGDKETFKEWRRDIRNPIDRINPGDFEDANNDKAQMAVELMGLSLGQLLEYNRVTLGDIASLGGMIRREHYPSIAILIKRLESGDELAPKNFGKARLDVQTLFAYSCKHLPAMAWFLLHNAPSLMSMKQETLRSAYKAGSFPLAKALIAKGVSPGIQMSLVVLQYEPNPSLLSKLMDIPEFRLSSAPKKILGGLTSRLDRYHDFDNPNVDARAVESINVLFQSRIKVFQENIKMTAELLLCCLKYNSNHAEAINATRALAKNILSSFDDPKTTAEQTELLREAVRLDNVGRPQSQPTSG